MKRIIQGFILAIATLGFSGLALASEYTDVIDAFDHEIGDPFDVNLSVGYERFQRSALITREAFDETPHSWDYYAYRSMFEYKEVKHILNMGLEIGLFRDLSFRLGLPLILNDQRELSRHDDFQLTDVDAAGDPIDILGSTLKSPDRSGIDYISASLWWGILDQGRDDTKPNWTFFAEGRFGVGDTLKASASDDSDAKPGISRGLNELNFGTRLSRRFGVLDPYFGLEALLGFPKDGTGYLTERKEAQLNKLPPIRGTLDFGMEIVPWEIPEKYVKFSIIIGAAGKFYSEGRDYTPLFDVLGTSPYFTTDAQDYDLNSDGDVDLPSNLKWTGMTDVENYAGFEGRLMLMMRPAKYVKFTVGTILGHETEHFITKTDQCRSDNMNSSTQQCDSYNPGFRPELDDPGNRFRVERTFLWTFLVNASAMF